MSRTRRKNQLVGQFVAHPRELRESAAWRALPDNARRILDRLELEHMRHGGAENGALPCTYSDFVAAGVRRASVSLAIRQCAALGFLEVTRRGGRSNAEYRNPSSYRLTYLNGRGTSALRTDEWAHIACDEDAMAALRQERCSKNPKTPDAPAYPAPDALAELSVSPSRTRKRNSYPRRESGTPIYISGTGRC